MSCHCHGEIEHMKYSTPQGLDRACATGADIPTLIGEESRSRFATFAK